MRIDLRQRRQRFIERQQIDIGFGLGRRHRLVQRQFRRRTAAFLAVLMARVIDENAPHHLRRDPEEVRAVLPLHVAAGRSA